MRNLLIFIIISGFVHTTLFAQTCEDYSQKFEQLKSRLVETGSKNGSVKDIKEVAKQLDAFLSHVYIGRSDGNAHNEIPFLTCRYEHAPLTTKGILIAGNQVDTIRFENGRWYITKELTPDMHVDLLCFDERYGVLNKKNIRTVDEVKKKYSFPLGEELVGKKGSVFFVKQENLYYAAIESKKIPAFKIHSNSEVINYASCLKAILKASGIEATYDEIIGKYLNTTVDEQFVPTKDCSKLIAGRKVVTTTIPQKSINASLIVEELVRERFMISIDKNGNIGLLTALALTGENDYQPVHVRLRMPMLSKEEQRVQMSWKDFSNRLVALIKVDIY